MAVGQLCPEEVLGFTVPLESRRSGGTTTVDAFFYSKPSPRCAPSAEL